MLSSLSSTIITVFDIADLAYLGPDASAKTLREQRIGGSARQPPLGQGMRVTANGRSPDRAGNELSHCAAGRASRSAVQRKRKVKSVLTHRHSKDEPVLPTPVWALWRELTANDVRGL